MLQQYKESPFYGEDEIYEMANSNPQSFFDEVDSVKRELIQYEDNIERIEGLQRRSLAESRAQELEQLQRQIDMVHSDCRGMANQLKHRIKALESHSFHDLTRHAQSENLRRQFMNLLQKFQSSEAAFRQRYQDVAARQYRIIQPDASDAQIQQMIEEGERGQVFSQALMNVDRRGVAHAALTEVQQRHREIQKIETTMVELAQIFHDMEIAVAEQSEQVEQVAQNTELAQEDVERGLVNQIEAKKKAKAWRRKKWTCLIILAVIVIILALVLGIYFGTHN